MKNHSWCQPGAKYAPPAPTHTHVASCLLLPICWGLLALGVLSKGFLMTLNQWAVGSTSRRPTKTNISLDMCMDDAFSRIKLERSSRPSTQSVWSWRAHVGAWVRNKAVTVRHFNFW